MESAKALFMKKPTGGYFVGYTRQRVQHNKNFLAAVTGPTGSGKTYSALRLAELGDPNFSPDQIVFTPQEFMSLLQSGKLKRGSVIVFEEVGVSLNNRNWQSVVNKMLQFVFQTFRHENYIVYFTAPHFNFIDKATRELFHSFLQTQSIDRKNKTCQLKPLFIQIDQRSGNMYYKYLRVITPQGNAKMTKLKVTLPSKYIIEEYEKKKKRFTDNLNKDVWDSIKETEPEEDSQAQYGDFTEQEWKRLEIIDNMRDKKLKWDTIGAARGLTGEAQRLFWTKHKEKYLAQKSINFADNLGSRKA